MKRLWAEMLLISFLFQCIPLSHVIAADSTDTSTKTVIATVDDEPSYTKLRQIDLGTFNEYRYKLTEQYFALRQKYSIDGTISKDIVTTMADIATKGYHYLPDNLNNKNRYNDFITEIKKAIKYPDSDTNYTSLIKSLQNYLESTDIKSVTGTIEASPKSGNAPLTVTLRAKVTDPTWTQIPSYNYIWWIDNAGQRQIIGRQVSLNYTFREEGNFSVFLDVVSAHKNESWYTDVLPFSSRTDIQVQEKIASLILKVNGEILWDNDTLKFTPDEGTYGLIYDATSSTPTSGTKFIRTEWDFGNGIRRIYNGAPRIERVIYGTDGEFPVTLKLTTNELKTLERQFTVSIHRPIATIQTTADEGFIGDKVTFKARPSGKAKDLTYSWEIINIDKDESILKKEGGVFTYMFTNKGKFNVKLKVTDPTGETDVDTKIIYINSRPPVAEFTTHPQRPNRPNTIIFDGSRSYDPDYTDDGNLKYNWIIDGEKVILENPNYNGSVGTYTFDSVGDHSVALEVVDPDNISATKKSKVTVSSILAVDLLTFPRVIQRSQFIKLQADSKEATFYEWEFGDGQKIGSKTWDTTHVYQKSWVFDVKVTVRDADGGVNTDTKKVYVWNSNSPVAMLQVEKGSSEIPEFDKSACGWAGAYEIDKVTAIRFDAAESINIDGQQNGLSYSWKVGQGTFSTAKTLTHTFDEIGCFPVKLSVKSDTNGKIDSMQTMVEVKNLAPVLSSLQISIVDPATDPVVVNVSALGAKDPDGVIQSYLWYYYTDTNNDPQDFRATTTPKTTFVLPKVTGNYYFVLVMKDNNEVKVNSEEIAGQRYSITLSGDNVNTPIIDLKVNDSSVTVWQAVVFTAQAKNILWQDIGPKADYYWDFDGDGFYDKQTKENTITFAYQKAGEFFPKVKVKNKWFSNVRNLQVNVTNNIVADFNYISIWNTFVFLNTSEGKTDSASWNFWDGNRVEWQDTVTHVFADGNNQRIVELTVSDGTKVKKISKKVLPDIRNILKARKQGLNVFTYPEYDENDKITLAKATDKLYIYLAQSKGDIAKYGIDYDLEMDSDLNGGKDDDEDNKGTSSYTSWDPIEVKLNNKKSQKIRVFTKDTNGVVLESKDLEIIKSYVTEENIDPSVIKFTSLNDEDKAKVEKVKTFISNLPEAQKNEGLKLLSKLQDDWLDENERTKTILDLEAFLGSSQIQGGSDMVDTLESLLVTGQDDKSQKNIAFNALKSLIPDALACTTPDTKTSCKEYLVSQLEIIKGSTDIEANKKVGTSILKILETAEWMTPNDKVDFKAVLKTFVYGGVQNIPTDEQNQVKQETQSTAWSAWWGASILGIFWYIFLGLAGLIWIFLIAAILFWVYFKLSNKDEDVGFQDFIIKKTWGWNGKDGGNKNGNEKQVIDVLSETKVEIPQKEVKEAVTSSTPSVGNDIPDWLKGASELSAKETTIQPEQVVPVMEVQQPVKEPQAEMTVPPVEEIPSSPEWLLESDEAKTTTSETQNTEKIDAIPDWLQWAMTNNSENEVSSDETQPSLQTEEEGVEEPKQTLSIPPVQQDTTSQPSQFDINQATKLDDNLQIPDWLKGSFDETVTTEEGASEEAVIPMNSIDETNDDEEEVSENSSQDDSWQQPKKRKRKRKKKPVPEATEDTVAQQSPTNTSSDGLWQDGMQIPDWLQDTNPPDNQK